jgi:hypothetical protein
MLNHGAHINKRRQDVRVDREKTTPTTVRNSIDAQFHQQQPVWNGKRWDELTSEEMASYVQT